MPAQPADNKDILLTDENGLQYVDHAGPQLVWPRKSYGLHYALTREPDDPQSEALFSRGRAYLEANRLAHQSDPHWVTVFVSDHWGRSTKLRSTHVPEPIDDMLRKWGVSEESVLAEESAEP